MHPQFASAPSPSGVTMLSRHIEAGVKAAPIFFSVAIDEITGRQALSDAAAATPSVLFQASLGQA